MASRTSILKSWYFRVITQWNDNTVKPLIVESPYNGRHNIIDLSIKDGLQGSETNVFLIILESLTNSIIQRTKLLNQYCPPMLS